MRRPSLALNQRLLAWLRQDPLWTHQPLALRALLAWRARFASLSEGLSDLLPASQATLQPLFIVGPWRSGTTVMHELLHAALGWPTPLTWQCMDAAAFALQGSPRAQQAIVRPMDGLAIGVLSPQEDEFALLGLGVNSAYRAFWQPHRLPELHSTLDPAHWQRDLVWLVVWERFVRRVLGAHDRDGRVLIKSPNHSFRLPTLLQQHPGAKVVWMLRPGIEVLASNRRMWTQMAELHGLSDLEPGALDEFLAKALRHCAQVLDGLELSEGQLAFCSQEALRRDPMGSLSKVMAQLGLEAAPTSSLEAALHRTATGRVERYSLDLQQIDSQLRSAVEAFDAAQRRRLPA